MTLIAPLFGSGVVTEEAAPQLVDEQLFADELSHVARAVPKRRAEFGTARVCARRALARLGIAPCSLVPNEDRSPRWPAGVIGSMSHTEGYCAVAVAPASAWLSLGLDVEQDRQLEPTMIEVICTPRERARLAARDAILVFAAKEAYYKCQYPLTRRFLDFLEVEISLDQAQQTFEVGPLEPVAPRIRGRWLRARGLVLCSAELPPR